MRNKLEKLRVWIEFSNFGSAFLVAMIVYVLSWKLLIAFGTLVAVFTIVVNLKLFINDQLNQLLYKEKRMLDTTYVQLRGDIREIRNEQKNQAGR